jgi:hypothetical protein
MKPRTVAGLLILIGYSTAMIGVAMFSPPLAIILLGAGILTVGAVAVQVDER